jgi:Putative member of DMT superfamily (DUF486)
MPPSFAGLWPYLVPILFLSCSNIFMTLAWYGHLKFKSWPMLLAIVAGVKGNSKRCVARGGASCSGRHRPSGGNSTAYIPFRRFPIASTT